MIKSATIALISVIITSLVSANDDAPKLSAPAAALAAYEVALKKPDLEAAKDLTANLDSIGVKIDAKHHQILTARIAEAVKIGRHHLTPLPGSSKIIGDFAIVTRVGGPEDRPFYNSQFLIKQDGQWKVFPMSVKPTSSALNWSDEQKKQLSDLEEWFSAEKIRLYGPNRR